MPRGYLPQRISEEEKRKMKMKNIIMVCIGAVLAALLVFSPLGSLVFYVFLLCAYLIYRYADGESRAFLVKLFIAGFLIRIPLAILNYFLGLCGVYGGSDTQPDAIIYNSNAFYIAKVMSGFDFSKDIFKEPFLIQAVGQRYAEHKGVLPQPGTYQFSFYVNFIGFLYSCFGYSPIAAKLLNGLMGCISAILAYVIAKVLVKVNMVAKVSAALVMFFPSSLYWSVTLLQDSIVNCLFLLYALSSIVYLKSSKQIFIVTSFLACLALSLLKDKIALLLWAGFVLFLMIGGFQKILRKKMLLRSVLFLIIFVGCLCFMIVNHDMIAETMERNLLSIFSIHKGTVTSYQSASTFKLYNDEFYLGPNTIPSNIMNISIIVIILKAVLYYFLSPFPWGAPYLKPSLLFFYPQVIFTIFCLPFMVLGIIDNIKHDRLGATSLLILLIIIIIPQAMAEGIVGNVVRHRDMFTPFIIIFSTYGFYRFFKKDESGL